jgi:hypothetical protein
MALPSPGIELEVQYRMPRRAGRHVAWIAEYTPQVMQFIEKGPTRNQGNPDRGKPYFTVDELLKRGTQSTKGIVSGFQLQSLNIYREARITFPLVDESVKGTYVVVLVNAVANTFVVNFAFVDAGAVAKAHGVPSASAAGVVTLEAKPLSGGYELTTSLTGYPKGDYVVRYDALIDGIPDPASTFTPSETKIKVNGKTGKGITQITRTNRDHVTVQVQAYLVETGDASNLLGLEFPVA